MSGITHAGSEPVDEAQLLTRATEDIKRNVYFMKRGFDQNSTVLALSHASQVIQHLRTAKLSPSSYYELWMKAVEAMHDAEEHFDDLDSRFTKSNGADGQCVADLYEIVQHAGNVIPRLYLLITVASTYIKTKRAPAKDVLFDLVELCRGVQHPMRGLFLRSYLSQMAKDKLPDTGSEYEGEGGSVTDAIEFILQNFSEMNKLWVRMQHQGAVRDRPRRERERRSLRELVGTSLVRLSNLAGLTLPLYRDEVLPRVLEQVVNCQDVMAQEFLMDCLIQVFPDEFHLETLEMLLSSIPQLQDGVNTKDILTSLMDRLASAARTALAAIDGGAGSSAAAMQLVSNPLYQRMLPLLSDHTAKIVTANPRMSLADVLALQVALLTLSSIVHPDRVDFVDQTLGFAAEQLRAAGPRGADSAAVSAAIRLLTLPLHGLGIKMLRLTNYEAALSTLALPERKQVASTICESLIAQKTPLDDVGTLDALLVLITPLLKDDPAAAAAARAAAGVDGGDDADESAESYVFEQEQGLVCRLFHLIGSDDIDTVFKLYLNVRKYFGQGGNKRIASTLPTLIYGALRLAERAHAREQDTSPDAEAAPVKTKTKRVFQFIHETIVVLVEPYPEMALRLFIQAAVVADKCGHEAIAYEFAAQAFIAYETEIAESKAQLAALTFVVGALPHFSSLNKENYDTLASKATQYSARLLTKPDQCRAVLNCAHLFWPVAAVPASSGSGPSLPPQPVADHVGRDDRRVLQCLKRALNIADACMGSHAHLFVEILNRYIYFYDKGCPSIEVKFLRGLTALIDESLASEGSSAQTTLALTHYRNTQALLQARLVFESESAADSSAAGAATAAAAPETAPPAATAAVDAGAGAGAEAEEDGPEGEGADGGEGAEDGAGASGGGGKKGGKGRRRA